MELWFVADAWAYHQHHPPGLAAQVDRVAANARRFYRRWGFWPMPDRLAALAGSGALHWDPEGTRCAPAGAVADGGVETGAVAVRPPSGHPRSSQSRGGERTCRAVPDPQLRTSFL